MVLRRGFPRLLRLLLDSHCLLWALEDSPRLPTGARRAIAGSTASFVSVASVWELEIKRATGRLEAPEDLPLALAAGEYQALIVTVDHAVAAGRLPLLHRDPFDRMLVAQAMVEGLTLVTGDTRLARYGVPVLWG